MTKTHYETATIKPYAGRIVKGYDDPNVARHASSELSYLMGGNGEWYMLAVRINMVTGGPSISLRKTTQPKYWY